jgi:hypothetical protein
LGDRAIAEQIAAKAAAFQSRARPDIDSSS